MQGSKKLIVILTCGVFLFGVCAGALAVERTLAGIKLGSAAASVLKRFGNPTRITVGSTAVGINATGPVVPGGPTVPGMTPAGPMPAGPTPGGALAAAGGFAQSYSNYLNNAMGATGNDQLPPLPGLTPPGMGTSGLPGMPAMPGMPGGSQTGQPILTEEQVTWTYDLTNGTTLEFIISENGKVIQITVGGEQAYTGSKTSKGIKLGSYYKDVIFKYGYPERQEKVGRFIRASYADKDRVVFTFLGKKLVGVTIALKPENED